MEKETAVRLRVTDNEGMTTDYAIITFAGHPPVPETIADALERCVKQYGVDQAHLVVHDILRIVNEQLDEVIRMSEIECHGHA